MHTKHKRISGAGIPFASDTKGSTLDAIKKHTSAEDTRNTCFEVLSFLYL